MDNRHGLTAEDIRIILSAFRQPKAIERAVLFGSRAMGKFRPGSDVDIALYGNNMESSVVARISDWLKDETRLPCHMDLLDFKAIQEPALRAHIDSVGILL